MILTKITADMLGILAMKHIFNMTRFLKILVRYLFADIDTLITTEQVESFLKP